MHKVHPSAGRAGADQRIAQPIQKLNRLAQISILQALTSSPEALMAQLANMARNGTVPMDLATKVRAIVDQHAAERQAPGSGDGLIDAA